MNLLIVTADDLNFDCMGCFGNQMGVTPNLDEFVRESFGFEHMHTPGPICQPSRSALMTGKVPHRNGALGFHPVYPDIVTLPEHLSRHGWFTAGINKLTHMAPVEKFGWNFKVTRARAYDPISLQDSPRNPANYRVDMLQAIRESRRSGKPFFINANIIDPHRPFHGTDRDQEMGGGEVSAIKPEEVVIPGFLEELPEIRTELAQYYSSVRRFDQSFGEIIQVMKKEQLWDDTIVLFISDHGMPFPFAKTTLYNSGTRTPLFIRYPGVRAGWIDRNHLVSNMDVMPTLLELLKVGPLEDLDGKSLLPILQGDTQDRSRVFSHLTSNSKGECFPSRSIRTRGYSFIWNSWSDGKTRFHNESMSGLTFDAMEAAGKTNPEIQSRVRQFLYRAPEEFYDLEKDPFERVNRIQDASCQGVISELRESLRDHMGRTGDPLGKKLPSGSFPLDQGAHGP